MLARGEADVFIRSPPLGYGEKIWDHAAAYVVLSETDGKVTDVDERPIDFGLGERKSADVTGVVTTVGGGESV